MDSKQLYELKIKDKASVASCSTDMDLLDVLSKHKKTSVRIGVARNEYTSEAVLERLSKDRVKSVRCAVVENRHCSDYLLNILIRDPEEEVVARCIKRIEDIPKDVLDVVLSKKKFSGYMRNIILVRKECPVSILKEYCLEYLYKVLANPNVNDEVRYFILNNGSYSAKTYLAKDEKTPVDILNMLRSDPNTFVREAAIKNLNECLE